ncbi:uncharacterized protein C1orf198 homolog isoform X2 [Gorilla gorilla gorilla]|uniref:uncharacterized protein C1orf198 homolog isoform X2 n=1 Tax=Gorilla gorilla gorilla TaxID=9595 RepID=UPI0030084837
MLVFVFVFLFYEWTQFSPESSVATWRYGGHYRELTTATLSERRARAQGHAGYHLSRDLTWQDEHSAPFSWETKSQMEFSISALSIQEPSNGTTASEPRPLSKASQGSQALKSSQGSRSSSLDALGPTRKEEEASFWKINAERSRGEGPEAEFQSLTPSQIKSMEKGEKVLPPCYRQEPAPKDREAKVERPSTLRQEQRPLPNVSTERERPQPVQAFSSALHEAAPSQLEGKLPSPDVRQDDGEDTLFSEPKFAQVSSSNVVLKTGFDFLDNW